MENDGEERNREKADRTDKEIYQETSNVVRYGEALSKEFWTREGVRQGCVLSSALFTLFLADIEEMLAKEQCDS